MNEMISIVIATYNSEKLLPMVIESIKKQDYPHELIEILVIDGGSTDGTRAYAESAGCKVYDNPRTEPGNAKLIGFNKAQGKYMMVLDHDEVLVNKSSIRIRIEGLKNNPMCKIAHSSGYKRPKGYPGLSQYISEFGDPFSLFIYNNSKDWRYLAKWVKKTADIINETSDWFVASFKKNKPLFELICASTIVDREYLIKNTNCSSSVLELAHAFYVISENGYPNILFSKNDPVEHYSSDTLKKYLPKIKWRICNNIHFPEGKMGFSGRENYNAAKSYKKFLFVIYSLFFPFSLSHSIYLALSRKNTIYLLHPVLCLYVIIQICYQYGLKLLGKAPSFTSYDGKKKIERNAE